MRRLAGFAMVCLPACAPAAVEPARSPEPESRRTVARLESLPEAPATPAPVAAASPPWHWVLSQDHGIRNDEGGAGGFLAPRGQRAHHGIDLLAAIGTPVIAPCAGRARAGKNSAHGKWVQLVCPLPSELGLAAERRVSLFFAHLFDVADLGGDFASVEAGATLGHVGKTGNAAGSSIAPHLHFEAILRDDEATASEEHHSGRDASETLAAREVGQVFATRCLAPLGLRRTDGDVWLNRRVDPFILLTCLGAKKPSYSRPKSALAKASYPFSSAYHADAFDVDGAVPSPGGLASR